MNGLVRSIRFARVSDTTDDKTGITSGARLIARVLLDEAPAAVGTIVTRDAGNRWCYLHADSSDSGLTSNLSRPDLERQIVLFHFGDLSPETAAATAIERPLRLAG
jgi:hypothetical protein